jgi:hypothetical protein
MEVRKEGYYRKNEEEGRKDGRPERRKDGRTEGRKDRRTEGQKGRRTDGRTEVKISRKERRGRMEERIARNDIKDPPPL